MEEGEGHRTPLDYQRILLDDPVRVSLFDRALRALVRPGDVGLDLGAGTGLLAMLAARAGASRVHAVESMPVADLAEALVRHNGLEGIVQVHRADARTLEPVDHVDLVVSDFMGRFVVDDEMLGAVGAASGWMRSGARFCPSEVRMLLAPVAGFAMRQVDRWTTPLLGLDLTPAAHPAMHSCFVGRLGSSQVLGEPGVYHVLQPPSRGGEDLVGARTIARDPVCRAT